MGSPSGTSEPSKPRKRKKGRPSLPGVAVAALSCLALRRSSSRCALSRAPRILSLRPPVGQSRSADMPKRKVRGYGEGPAAGEAEGAALGREGGRAGAIFLAFIFFPTNSPPPPLRLTVVRQPARVRVKRPNGCRRELF